MTSNSQSHSHRTILTDSGYNGDYSPTASSGNLTSRNTAMSTMVEDVAPMHDQQWRDQPRPLQVIRVDEENHTFTLDEAALSSVLLRPDVVDKKVAVVSVAGAYRKGKSFLLNFLLRYFQSNQCNSRWLGEENSQLKGFNWCGGSDRITSGILLWSEPFFTTLASGEEIAVLLIDTQGAFDSQSTVKDCATVFALSTMISSVQIYNLSQNIQEDDLQHLHLFTDYGRLALESHESKPFQTLVFLVRDWSFPYEANYGFEGGATILERRLQASDKQHQELQRLRHDIRSCFSEIKCFLMPHPGLRVATSQEFRGQLHDIETEFKNNLNSFVPGLLAPDSLVLKEINGQKVTGLELMEYFRAYIKIFQGEELPEPKSILLATAEANNLAAVVSSKAHYVRQMQEICGGDTPYMAPDELESYHEKFKTQTFNLFKQSRKLGGDDYSRTFIERLDSDVMESYQIFIESNNNKNLFRSARTPAVLICILLAFYVLQELFQLFYLDFFAKLAGGVLGLVLFTIGFWAYTKYSGNMREVGAAIDDMASQLYDKVLLPLGEFMITQGVRHAANIQTRMNDNASGVRRSASSSGSANRFDATKKRN